MSGTINFPANPTVGQLYTFGGSTWQWNGTVWINANLGQSFLPTAGGTISPGPLNVPALVATDNSTQASSTSFVTRAVAPSLNNVGRNYIHNPYTALWQRGLGAFTSGYTADRWALYGTNDTVSVGGTGISTAQMQAIGNEYAITSLVNNFTGSSAANSCNFLGQPVESVRRLSNKQIIVSFWAWCGSGTLLLGVGWDQQFGAGGSPSPIVTGTGQAVTITTTPTRYFVILTLPSVAGKTIGTQNTDNTLIEFWYSAQGTANNVRAGNIGVQSGTVAIWGIQVEAVIPGSGQTLPSPLQMDDLWVTWAQCLRFYYGSGHDFSWAFNAWAANAWLELPLAYPSIMRATPTIVLGPSSANTNISSLVVSNTTPEIVSVRANATAAGGSAITMSGYTASADL
jgi:hypothetical protein